MRCLGLRRWPDARGRIQSCSLTRLLPLLLPLLLLWHAPSGRASVVAASTDHCQFTLEELARNHSQRASILWQDPREAYPQCRNALRASMQPDPVGVVGSLQPSALRPPDDLLVESREWGDGGCVKSLSIYERFARTLSHHHTFAYVVTPKAGSVSTKSWLDHVGGTNGGKRPVYAPHTFMTVRHPLSRFESCVGTVVSRNARPGLPGMLEKAHDRLHKCAGLAGGGSPPSSRSRARRQFRRQLVLANGPRPSAPATEYADSKSLLLRQAAPDMLALLRNPRAHHQCRGHGWGVQFTEHCWTMSGLMAMFPCEGRHTDARPAESSAAHRNLFTVDAIVYFEDYENQLRELRQTAPWSDALPQIDPSHENPAEGRGGVKAEHVEHWFPCDLAWEVYDFYKQDFVCFDYKMPSVCLQAECRPVPQ